MKVEKVLTKKSIKITFLVAFAYKLVCTDDEFTKPIVAFWGENTAYEIIEGILKEYEYCKK